MPSLFVVSIDEPPPPPPPSRIVGLQLMFDFTRTHVLEPSLTGPASEEAKVSVDPRAPWVLTVRWPPGLETRLFSAGGLTINVPYVGEHLRPLGHIWLREREGQLLNAIDEDQEIANWLKCRANVPRSDRAHRLFLRIEKATLLDLLERRDPKRNSRRIADIQDLNIYLGDRLRQRRGSDNLDTPNRKDERKLRHVSSILRAAIQGTYKNDVKGIRDAFDKFAAGLLQQECKVTHPDLVGSMRVACDADSAMLFLFAELALAIRDRAIVRGASKSIKAEAAFWRPLLNCLVRMQWIYIKRHKIDQQRLNEYGKDENGEPPKPMSEAKMRSIVAKYRKRNLRSTLLAANKHARHAQANDP